MKTAFTVLAFMMATTAFAADFPNYYGAATTVDTSGFGNVSGTGVTGRVAIWNGTNTITSDPSLTYSAGLLTAQSISTSLFVGTSPGSAANTTISLGSVGKGFYDDTASRLGVAAGSVAVWTFANSYSTSKRALGIRADGGADFTPSANLHVSGTALVTGNTSMGATMTASATLHVSGTSILGIGNSGVTCGATQDGAVVYSRALRTLAACNGLNSWIPMVSTSLVSASAL